MTTFKTIMKSFSFASLPITLQCMEVNVGIDLRVTRFVLPIGTTLSRDGTALYEAVAAVFIAQVNQHPLSFGNYVVITLMSIMAAISTASVPSGGLFSMIIVLGAVGLPLQDISLILAVDWFL